MLKYPITLFGYEYHGNPFRTSSRIKLGDDYSGPNPLSKPYWKLIAFKWDVIRRWNGFWYGFDCEACSDTGEGEDSYGCPECCEHEFDWSVGYTCLNCGTEGDVGAAIDAAEYICDPER